MDSLLSNIKIHINEKLYLKDPESSDLGKQIVSESVQLIHELGFEDFTFKKLGQKIGSNESSIYRYFENKHKLLLYLSALYWGVLEYRLVFTTNSIENHVKKLLKAIDIVTTSPKNLVFSPKVNQELLREIVVSEFTKSYHIKNVDAENQEGYFSIYKRIILRIADMIVKVDPSYPYPKSLTASIVEGALHQDFLMIHFKSITDCTDQSCPLAFYQHMIQKLLNIPNEEL
jgi:AcrR family transcriptional regulator